MVFDRRQRRRFAVAVGLVAVNPFAQLSRFIPNKRKRKFLRGPEDLPWKKPKEIEPDLPHKIRTILQDSGSASAVGDTVVGSFANMPATPQPTKVPGSGHEAGLTETPVDEVTSVHRGPPNYTFASLPFVYDTALTVARAYDQWSFRMNSPYDCSVSATQTDRNVGAGSYITTDMVADASDNSFQNAQWYQFYADMYKYYHVISCRWRITFENMMTEPIWIHQYYSNADDRPWWASNQDMLTWGDTRSHYVGAQANAILGTGSIEAEEMEIGGNQEDAAATGNTPNYENGNHVVARGPSPILQLSGTYQPGDYDREIRLDSEVENWTAVSANPILSERLHFRIKPLWDAQPPAAGNASNYDRQLVYRWRVELEYLTEFKELKDGLRYPTVNQPMRVTVTGGTSSTGVAVV